MLRSKLLSFKSEGRLFFSLIARFHIIGRVDMRVFPGGVLSGKAGTGMCGPDMMPFRPLRFTNGLFLFENLLRYRSRFCKMLYF